MAAVQEIDAESDNQPSEEAQPSEDRQPGHQQQTKNDAQNRRSRPAGGAEPSMPLGLAIAKYENTNRHQHEGKQRADVGEIGSGADIEHACGNAYDESRNP